MDIPGLEQYEEEHECNECGFKWTALVVHDHEAGISEYVTDFTNECPECGEIDKTWRTRCLVISG